ncbi:MAG: hypothetical protein IKK04_07885 [Bacteroidales bacterium]|nr:hypothetical protein [Bacteroidales bacterium]
MMNNFKTNRLASLQRLAAVPLVLLILLWPAKTALCQDAPVSFPGSTAQPLPAGWQQSIASLEEPYPAIQGDTVITRTCGTSLSVSCVRYTEDNKSHYTFVVRERDSVQRCRTFQALASVADTLANCGDSLIEYQTLYHVKDMRVADSMCFFCGTKRETATFLSILPGGNTAPSQVEKKQLYDISVGFIGRFSLAKIVTPVPISEAPQGPETRGDDSGTVEPQGILPTRVGIRILPIEETSVLDKMWIDEGLYIDFSVADLKDVIYFPFAHDTVYYDPDFPPDSVQAFIVGRLKDNASRSCVVNVQNLLSSQSDYTVKVSPIQDELFYDVTGIDARVILSSRFGLPGTNGTVGQANGLMSNYACNKTFGVRVKDLYRNQVHKNTYNNTVTYTPWSPADYQQFGRLHLYQCGVGLDDYPGSEKHGRNYGRLCRMKNHHASAQVNNVYYGEEFTNQDFCMVARLKNNIGVIHIDQAMTPIYNFYSRNHPSSRVADVVCVGNTHHNSIAIAHYDYMGDIDLVDWGSQESGVYMQILHFNPSVNIYIAGMNVSSLDMYHNGTTLLAGGIKNEVMTQAVQRKNAWSENWTGDDTNIVNQPDYYTCFGKQPLRLGDTFQVGHEFHESELEEIVRTRYPWNMPFFRSITDIEVGATCTTETDNDN